MLPEVLKHIEELYLALKDAGIEQRAMLLAAEIPEIRDRVNAMLVASDGSADNASTTGHTLWHGRNPPLEHTQIADLPVLQLGPYRIIQRLGEGGMGQVYRAVDTRLGRAVAIKMLSPALSSTREFRLRFLQEARAVCALNHPNVVVLYDIANHDGTDFLVMEYVEGRTLREMISVSGMTFHQLVRLCSQVALALAAAHAAGIVHRDVKPSNILVTSRQEVKVLDFGIAKTLLADGADVKLTQVGAIVGTAAYMSPEQARGQEVDARSDIFSFGCVLYEAATGCQPFVGESTLAVLHQILTVDPVPPDLIRADLPREFASLVMRCLEKTPERRTESATELATQLKAYSLPEKPVAILRAGLPTIAILPLQVRGPVAEQYLSISLADALIHRLSSSGKLVVRPIASVMRYGGQEVAWPEAARELNVDFLVEGIVQIMGTKVRILIQAHRISDSHTIASLKADGDSSDLFELQDRIADAVCDTFLPRQKQNIQTESPSRHAGAYELYLRAVDRQVHVDKFEMASAISILTRATELDPTFSDAWGLLSQACAQMGSHLDPDTKWFDLGEHAIAKALELDPVQCDALTARSVILWSASRKFQNRAALRALNAVLKIDPLRITARHQRCAILWHLGFYKAAAEDAEELQSPALAAIHKAHISLFQGDFEASTHHFEAAQRLESGSVLAYLHAPVAPLWAGRMDEARKALDNANKMTHDESFTMGLEAVFAAIDGNFARAETLAEVAARGRSLTHSHHTWHFCADAWALCGRPDKALAELRRCADLGLPNHRIFEIDPSLRSLRDYPDFRTLMQSLRSERQSFEQEFGLATNSRSAG